MIFRLPDALRRSAYRQGGRSIDEGLDCWGYYRELRRFAGLSVPPAEVVASERYIDAAKESDDWEVLAKPVFGALVLWRKLDGTWHCGFAVDDVHVLHMTRTGGSYLRLDRRHPYGNRPLFAAYKGGSYAKS